MRKMKNKIVEIKIMGSLINILLSCPIDPHKIREIWTCFHIEWCQKNKLDLSNLTCDIEIIGNIKENPELLEVKNDKK